MRTRVLATLALFGALSTPALAQGAAAQNTGSMAAVRPLYEQFKSYLLRSAALMPEEQYGFQPTPEVRTFGRILGHVANSHYMFCSAALGEENPNDVNFEETTSKAELTAALEASVAYCDRAFAMADARALEETQFFGRTGTRLWILVFCLTHDSEHYGNLVTYFRLNGIVPPSSQRG